MEAIFLLSELRCYRASDCSIYDRFGSVRRSFSIYELDDFCIDVKCKNLLENRTIEGFVLCCRIFNSLYEEVCVDLSELKLVQGEEKRISFNFNLSSSIQHQKTKDLFIICSGYSLKAIATGAWKRNGRLTIDKTITIASALRLNDSPLDYNSYLEIEKSIVTYAHELPNYGQIEEEKSYEQLKDYIRFSASFYLLFKAKKEDESYTNFLFLINLINEQNELVLTEKCQLRQQSNSVDKTGVYYVLSDTKKLSHLPPGEYKIEVEYLGKTIFQKKIILGENKKFN